MPFDPTKPYELVSAAEVEPPPFDPSKPYDLVSGPLNGHPGAAAPVETWKGLNTKAGELAGVPDDIKQTAILQEYVKTKLPEMGDDAISGNWDAVKSSYFDKITGRKPDGPVSDDVLYKLVHSHEIGGWNALTSMQEKMASLDRLGYRSPEIDKGYTKSATTDIIDHFVGIGVIPDVAGEFLKQPAKLPLPEKLFSDDAVKAFYATGKNGINPEVLNGVWSGFVKPTTEFIASPEGIALFGVSAATGGTGPIARAGFELTAKAARTAISTYFAYDMAKSSVENYPHAVAIMSDESKSLEERVAAGSGLLGGAAMAIGAGVHGMGGFMPEVKSIKIIKKLGGNPHIDAGTLRAEAQSAKTADAKSKLEDLAGKIEELAPDGMEKPQERILGPVVVEETDAGQVAHRGINHASIRELNSITEGNGTDLFITSDGRVVDRVEAHGIADNAKQIKPQFIKWINPEDFKPDPLELGVIPPEGSEVKTAEVKSPASVAAEVVTEGKPGELHSHQINETSEMREAHIDNLEEKRNAKLTKNSVQFADETRIDNASVDDILVSLGEHKRTTPERISNVEQISNALDRAKKNKGIGDELVDRVLSGEDFTASDAHQADLLIELARRKNAEIAARKAYSEALDSGDKNKIEEAESSFAYHQKRLIDIAEATGSKQMSANPARSMQLRSIALKSDYSVAKLIFDHKKATGKMPTLDEVKELTKKSDDLTGAIELADEVDRAANERANPKKKQMTLSEALAPELAEALKFIEQMEANAKENVTEIDAYPDVTFEESKTEAELLASEKGHERSAVAAEVGDRHAEVISALKESPLDINSETKRIHENVGFGHKVKLFKKGGMSLDSFREKLVDLGLLDEKSTTSDALSLIEDAFQQKEYATKSTGDIRRKVKSTREKARAEIDKIEKQGRSLSAPFMDPEVAYYYGVIYASHIADVALTGAELTKYATDKMVEQFGEKVIPHMKEIIKNGKSIEKRTRSEVKVKAVINELDLVSKQQDRRVAALERIVEKQKAQISIGGRNKGITRRPEVERIEVLLQEISANNKKLNELDRKDRKTAAEADEADSISDKIKSIHKEIEANRKKLESGGVKSKKQPVDRPSSSSELEIAMQERDETRRQIRDAKKAMDESKESSKPKKKTEAEKEAIRLTREIKEIERQLNTGEIFRDGKPEKMTHQENIELAGKLDELKERRKYERERIQPKPEPDTAEKKRMNAMEKRIDELKRKLRTDEVFDSEKTKSDPISPAEEAMRKELTDLQAEVDHARDRIQPDRITDEIIAKRTGRLEELLKRYEDGDFSKKKPPVNVPYTQAELELKNKAKKLKDKYDSDMKDLAYEKTSPYLKGLHTVVWASHNVILSGVGIIGKLAASSAITVLKNVPTEAMGILVSKLPGVKEHAMMEARSWGSFSAGEKAAAKSLWKAPSESLKALTGEKTEYEMYLDDTVPWHAQGYAKNIVKFFGLNEKWTDGIGRVHKAGHITPIVTGFARKVAAIEVNMIEAGLGDSLKEPAVFIAIRERAALEALNDGYMEKNRFLTGGISATIKWIESKGRETKCEGLSNLIVAVINMDQPVKRIPINVLSQGAEMVHGLGSGGAVYLDALRTGFKNMDNHTLDLAVRRMKNGGMGAVIGIGAYALYKSGMVKFGGGRLSGERYGKENDDGLKRGDVMIAGKKISHKFLHNHVNTVINTLISGHQLAEETYENTGSHDYINSYFRAVFGAIQDAPGIQESITQVISSTGHPLSELSKWLATRFIPSMSDSAAKYMDTESGEDEATKRYPSSLTEAFKARIPGLRSSVPTTRQPGFSLLSRGDDE